MDKFIIRKPRRPQDSSSTQDADLTQDSSSTQDLSSKHGRVDVNNLPLDPGLRKKISFYHPNDRDEIRRYYLQKKTMSTLWTRFSSNKNWWTYASI